MSKGGFNSLENLMLSKLLNTYPSHNTYNDVALTSNLDMIFLQVDLVDHMSQKNLKIVEENQQFRHIEPKLLLELNIVLISEHKDLVRKSSELVLVIAWIDVF